MLADQIQHTALLTINACIVLYPQDSESPYHYDAHLDVSVVGEQLTLTLSVVNRGKTVLPFGLGFHPYFPLTASTRIQFEAEGYRDERDDHLPAELAAIPAELNFINGLPVLDRSFHLAIVACAPDTSSVR